MSVMNKTADAGRHHRVGLAETNQALFLGFDIVAHSPRPTVCQIDEWFE